MHQNARVGILERTPLELHLEEASLLLPLPERPYETGEVLYRTVNSEGYISYLQKLLLCSLATVRATVTRARHRK